MAIAFVTLRCKWSRIPATMSSYRLASKWGPCQTYSCRSTARRVCGLLTNTHSSNFMEPSFYLLYRLGW